MTHFYMRNIGRELRSADVDLATNLRSCRVVRGIEGRSDVLP
jgi:hypothetical protein